MNIEDVKIGMKVNFKNHPNVYTIIRDEDGKKPLGLTEICVGSVLADLDSFVLTKTDQEVYDFVCAHLAKQKRRAVNDNGSCVYELDGNQCAIGSLILDKEVRQNLDGTSDNDDVIKALRASGVVSSSIFLRDLQKAHDLSVCANEIKERLVDTAKSIGLQTGAEQAIVNWKYC